MTKQKCERFILVRESDGAKVMDLWLGLELSVNPAFAEAGIKTSLTNALKKWLEHEEKGGVSFGSIPSLARRSAEKMPHHVDERIMSDHDIEHEIQAKGLTAPRVTPADIEKNIVG